MTAEENELKTELERSILQHWRGKEENQKEIQMRRKMKAKALL